MADEGSFEKKHDPRFSELEQKLCEAEDRCSVLRRHVQYMKMLYTSKQPLDDSPQKDDIKVFNVPSIASDLHTNSVYSFKTGKLDIEVSKMTVSPYELSVHKGTVKKDPIEVVQSILNGMTLSINEMEDINETESSQLHELREPLMKSTKKEEIQKKKKSKNTVVGNEPKAINGRTQLDSRKTEQCRSTPPSEKKNRKIVPNSESQKKKSVVPNPGTKGKTKRKPKSKKSTGERSCGSINDSRRNVDSTYFLSTASSRLKCVPRSHHHQFSFRRIPFTVGKSTNKSHNLGTKIQETLSLIKLAGGGLVRKYKNIEEDKTTFNNLLQQETGSVMEYTEPRMRYIPGNGSVSNLTRPSFNKLHGKASTVSMGASVDYKSYQLRSVLMNLHDEFSRMTEKYDKLQDEFKKTNDLEIDKELQVLEDELNTKENEINAFMNLYNEVSKLKDKLSFIEGRTSPHMKMLNRRTSRSLVRNDSTTFKMTRLLRKIEQFQDHLKKPSYQ